MRGKPLAPDEKKQIYLAHRRGDNAAKIAKDLGRSKRSVQRVLSAVRTAEDFTKRVKFVKPPRSKNGPVTWTLETIRKARNEQQAGKFRAPVALAEAFKTDTALYTAFHNRVDPQSAVDALLTSAGGVEGERTLKKANRSLTIPKPMLKDVHGTLADHGIAIGIVRRESNADGTLVNMRLEEWPLEHVWWDNSEEVLKTTTELGETVVITHGDGEWVVFRKFERKPWTKEAALLPAALLWPMHTEGLQDWAASARSHGLAKIVGELPEGIALMQENGDLSPEAAAFLDMITDIAAGDAQAGIMPPGADAKFVNNSSSAWQVFSEMIEGRERAAARIYLGTDATLGAQGGAPGVDISALFGVSSTKIQGDFEAIEQAISTGVIEPWAAINFGTSRHAPKLKYQFPDPDAEKKSEEFAERLKRLTEAVQSLKSRGFEVTQKVVDDLGKSLRLEWVPKLSELGARSDVEEQTQGAVAETQAEAMTERAGELSPPG